MVRDDEIQRLIRYAQGMGLSVRFKPYKSGSGDHGGWELDGSKIEVYSTPRSSKISKILTLIHEIAHHKGFIDNNRITDPKVVEAIEDEDEKKRSRRKIYLDEQSDTQYWEEIYKDTGCTFDIRKMYVAKEFDVWCYEYYYENGVFPNNKTMKEKTKEITKKYRSKK